MAFREKTQNVFPQHLRKQETKDFAGTARDHLARKIVMLSWKLEISQKNFKILSN